jgi:hypothetical protein
MVVFNRERNTGRKLPAAIERAQVKEREAHKQTDLSSADGTQLVARISEAIQENLNDDEAKPSVADLMRLLGLRRELAQFRTGTVKAGWIECRQTPAIDQ